MVVVKVVWQHAKVDGREEFALGLEATLSQDGGVVKLSFELAQVEIDIAELLLNLTHFGGDDLLIDFVAGLVLTLISLNLVP